MIRLAKAPLFILALFRGSDWAAERLISYPVHPAQVSDSRLPSSAFAAHPLNIAHSVEIMGATIVAAGLDRRAVLHATSYGVKALPPMRPVLHVDASRVYLFT
jgi:hypothetical protein